MNIHPLWFICLLTRSVLVYLVWLIFKKYKNNEIQIITKIILMIMGLGFIYQGLYSSNNEIQFRKVFWHDTRFVHGALYLLAVIHLLYDKVEIAQLLLSLDIIFSLLYRIYLNK